jgi:hypothetical protein
MNTDDTERHPTPEDVLIVLPVRDFGAVSRRRAAHRHSRASARSPPRRKRCARSAAWALAAEDATPRDPETDDLHRVGTVASIVRFVTAPTARIT